MVVFFVDTESACTHKGVKPYLYMLSCIFELFETIQLIH